MNTLFNCFFVIFSFVFLTSCNDVNETTVPAPQGSYTLYSGKVYSTSDLSLDVTKERMFGTSVTLTDKLITVNIRVDNKLVLESVTSIYIEKISDSYYEIKNGKTFVAQAIKKNGIWLLSANIYGYSTYYNKQLTCYVDASM